MKLSEWAKKHSLHYRTAWEHFRTGKIPNAYKLSTGTIIVPEDLIRTKSECNIVYARVSSSQNKDNLESQAKRLSDFCAAKGWTTHKIIKEVGSGLNDKRKKLIELLEDGKATRLIVEHKDRLSRFGVPYIEILCRQTRCELIIVNQAETDKEDLMQDFVNVVTSFCARLYGQRRSKRRTERLIKELNEN